MSSALAIAGVSAVLRDLLNDGLIQHNAAGVLGSSVTVSIGPPDRVVPADGQEASQLNLFLYQVTPNSGWRNEGLPSRDASGRQRLSNAPLALNLHYLLSAYGSGDLHGEILLGYAMQLLHETPVLTREAIHTALTPSPDVGDTLPPALRALADTRLENQIEQIKITPEYLNTEEMSKLWTATQSHLRPTVAYTASVVLIEATEPTHSPLPVLTIGPVVKPDPVDPKTWYERGVVVEPDLIPALPTLVAVTPAAEQPAAQLDTTITLRGHHLDAKPGTGRTVVLTNDPYDINEHIVAAAPPANGGQEAITFSMPADRADDFPVGIYTVRARLQRPDENNERETNRLGMTLAPKITGLPINVARDGTGTATFTLDFLPALRAGQKVVLVLGQQEIAPNPFTAPTTKLKFSIPHAPVGSHLARLRIDGIESPITDRLAKPAVFLNERIDIT